MHIVPCKLVWFQVSAAFSRVTIDNVCRLLSSTSGSARVSSCNSTGTSTFATFCEEGEGKTEEVCNDKGHDAAPWILGAYIKSHKVGVCTVRDCLPGSACDAELPPHLHCAAADSETETGLHCMAPLARGGRCKRKRAQGHYCKQHYLEWSGKDRVEKVWSSWSGHFDDAAVLWHTLYVSLNNPNVLYIV